VSIFSLKGVLEPFFPALAPEEVVPEATTVFEFLRFIDAIITARLAVVEFALK
jgi:hypothetical protein